MYITEFCAALPFPVLHTRIAKNEVPMMTQMHYLTGTDSLREDTLYLLTAEEAAQILPNCSSPGCATVLCLGAEQMQVVCKVSLNLIFIDCELIPLMNFLSDYLAQLRRHSVMQAERFRSKFSSIVENRLENGDSVDKLIDSFPKKFKSTYCVICIQTPASEGKILREQLMQEELEKLFPEDNIVPYDNDIIVIHCYNGFSHPPKLPTEEFSEILRRFDARAGISNGVQKPAKLRMMYILARQALEAGTQYYKGENRNIFFYDDMMLFCVVSLAAEAFLERYDDDDINLLGTPILINLIKHDPRNKKEYLETLYQYIVNGRSTTRTAAAMHLHRNTVQNRISAIEQIVGKDLLTDGIFQAKFLTTYYVVQYSTRIWHRELVLSPLYEEKAEETKKP